MDRQLASVLDKVANEAEAAVSHDLVALRKPIDKKAVLDSLQNCKGEQQFPLLRFVRFCFVLWCVCVCSLSMSAAAMLRRLLFLLSQPSYLGNKTSHPNLLESIHQVP